MASLVSSGPASEERVRSIQLPEKFQPDGIFHPLTHDEALEHVDNAIERVGLNVRKDQRRFTLAADGARMASIMPVDWPIVPASGDGRQDSVNLEVLVMNSFDKSTALKIGYGSQVFVCSNGMVFAEKIIGRKHTTNILRDLPVLTEQAISETEGYAQQQAEFFNQLREVELTPTQVNDIVMRLGRQDAITPSHVVKIVEEYHNPSYDDFTDPTAWSLFNAITEYGKRVYNQNGMRHADRMTKVSQMFREEICN